MDKENFARGGAKARQKEGALSPERKTFAPKPPPIYEKDKEEQKRVAALRGSLDKDNNLLTLSPKKKSALDARIKRSTKVPKTKGYHGTLVNHRTGPPEGAIYDLEDDTPPPAYDPMQLSVEELMQQPDFLRIDQSKLPLEIFDSSEYERLDRLPEEWLSIPGVHGYAPYYKEGQWVWCKCELLGHKEDCGKYTIRFSENSAPKDVHRLNLRISHEDERRFHERREVAEAGRLEAKKAMRFDHFVIMQSNDTVVAVQKETLKNIHRRVMDGMPGWLPFPDPGTLLGNTLRSSTMEVIHFYSRCMKKIVVFAKLRKGDPEMVHRANLLNLPALPTPPPVPRSGKVDCEEYSFEERKQRMEHMFVSATPNVMTMYKWLYTEWETTFQAFPFFDFGTDPKLPLNEIQLPCQLTDFQHAQIQCSEYVRNKLKNEFRRAIINSFMDHCQDMFDLFQSNVSVFKNGALHKLFKSLELRTAHFIRTMLLNALSAWLKFVEKHTTVISMELGSGDNSSMDGKRLSEMKFPLDPKKALFQAELALNAENKVVSMEPSPQEITSTFKDTIDRLVQNIKSVTTIEKDIMTLMQLEDKIVLNIQSANPLFGDLDKVIMDTKTKISKMLADVLVRPTEVVKIFQSYCWLLDESTEDYLERWSSRPNAETGEPEPFPLPFYIDELTKVNNALKEIQSTSYEIEYFGLIQLNVIDVRTTLAKRALDMRNGLLNILVLQCREENIRIIGEYKNILERIAVKPKNEIELTELRDFIEESYDTVDVLKGRVRHCRQKLSILDIYHVPLPIEDMSLSWSTLEYPSTIEFESKEVEITLDADKQRMIEKLETQKLAFETEMEEIDKEVRNAYRITNYDEKLKNAEKINALQDRIENAIRTGDDFNMREKVFDFAPTDYIAVYKHIEELAPFYKLWNMVADFHNSKDDWLHGEFKDLDGAKIEEDVTEWWKSSYKLSKQLEDDFPASAKCAAKLREETTEFRKNMPVIQSLASKALKTRHWEALSELLGKEINPEDELTLQDLLDLDAASYIEGIQEVTTAAEKEYNLERGLKVMKTEWESVDYEVKPFKDSGTYIVGGIDDIITMLDDHIVKIQTMRGSPYIKPIEKEAKDWEYRLKYATGLLDQWIMCQRTWMYLEPIFGSEDIMRQLPQEGRRFQTVDQLWRKTLADTANDPNFMVNADPEKGLDGKFKKANEKLDEITKGLNDYLEMKRLFFPRFFFLSADELLEILSQTKEPRAVQPHLGKCFEGINRVHFEPDAKITKIMSAEGETVKLDRFVDPETTGNKGNVEKWLLTLESIQWESIKTHTKGGLEEYPKISRKDWMLKWPAQVVLGVSSVYWTAEVTAALETGNPKEVASVYDKCDKQLKDIVLLVRGKLDKLQRKTLGALTTIDVHNRDVVAKMVQLGTSEVHDFEWMSQLRYYWEDAWKDGQATKKGNKTLVARIVNAKCLYGFEYLGNTMRLVITALTDRCYRTMIGAIDLLYGGAPEGPAGTGKTETVKDLSKAMAIHCVVFNCSDGLDYLAMAKFFKGLAGCGSWCCFDEFNRINIEVLSVIAQQILTINQAKRDGREMFHFEGTYMKLNNNCNVFITMNPGYAGRAELPDNLKALFRPCAMMVPDYAMIGEIRLLSFGYNEARSNAQKIVKVLQLCSEQLSSQKHYDYGMRAVNSILVAAGNIRQQLGSDPEWDEPKLILRSIIDVNLAKFLVEDIGLFNGILSDLFPGVILPDADYNVLAKALSDVCSEGVEIAPGNNKKLLNQKTFQEKTIQLYEMVLVRHGVMIVGETGSGKTSSIFSLAKAMGRANMEGHSNFQKTQIHVINPKSVTSGQLYGLFDENTHEFVDGILAVTFRKCAKDTSPDRKWLLFDGPVDAVWIENMNTVLDDNKKLCLNSGEIIKMSDQMTMMFETEDLEQASPATVSRVGMIFCECRNIGWQAVRDIWMDTLPEEVTAPEHLELIRELFDWLFPVASYFVGKFCKMPLRMGSQELMFSHTRLLYCMFGFDNGISGDLVKCIEGCFLFSLVWSVGACVDGEGRKKFNDFIISLIKGEGYETEEYKDFIIKTPDYKENRNRPDWSAVVPEAGTVYDYFFDTKTNRWINWIAELPPYKIPKEAQFNEIVVPTIDTVRNEWILEKLLKKGYHVMCTGDTGTGKSVLVKNKLLSGMPEEFHPIFLNFSAQTSANQTQDLIDAKLDKRRKGVLGPPLGSTAIVFVDDLNMPAKEVYGAQPPIEILRQWMDHMGWYDRKENEYRQLVDIQFCAAMGPPGGGRTRITQRYIRHFNLINFINFNDESLSRVFGTILDWRMQQGFASNIKSFSTSTVGATISVYNTIASKLLPTPAKSHYTFNLRDLSKVFQGLLQGDPGLIKEKDSFVRLWSHECMRVFHDRLVDNTDRCWFKDLISSTVKDSFGMEWNKIRGEHEVLIYCNFGDPKSITKPYAEWVDRSDQQKIMDEYLEDFNQMTTKPMSLVLFESAVEHISRISRIINQPYGNALLVGIGGSGRKSLNTLAVHIAGFDLFTIEITKSYSMFDWREDIKMCMNKAGVDNKSTVFMIDDSQLVKEAFLEDINGILNTGEVANLFNAEEMGVLTESLMKPCQEAGVNTGSQQEVYNFFVRRVRANLHMVICLSPIGEAFRRRLLMFPSLVNCCTIDWFTEWPEQALRSVAHYFLESVDLDANVRNGVVDVCVDMQVRVTDLASRYLAEMGRNYYVTPTSYLELINTFKALLSTQGNEIWEEKARYDNGLAKLAQTAEQVKEMRLELEALQPQLKVATVETEKLLVVINADTIVANEKEAQVTIETEKCNVQAKEAGALKDECEADLKEALPALEAAEKALNALKKADIDEMKSMKKPAKAIKMVMAACCIMLGVKPDKKVKDGDPHIDPYWGPAVKDVLGDANLLKTLKKYDRDNMKETVVTQAKHFTEDPEFEPEVVAKKGSVAAAGLAKWVHAMVRYDKVARIVAPKRAQLKEAEKTLKEAMNALAEKQAALKEVMDKVAELGRKLQEAEDKKAALKTQVDDCEAKLTRADSLIKGLGGEKATWEQRSQKLTDLYANVTGDVVLSSGVIAYLGAFVAAYREDAVREWSLLLSEKGIQCSKTFSLQETLGNPVTIRGWTINKLPNDSFSVENAIMLTRSNRWPLMIDPEGQANRWVKKMEGIDEKNSLLKVVKQSQSNFVRVLENAIQFGHPVLLENVPEAIDPILESVLLKQLVKSGGVYTIRLGDATIEYDQKFKLYITTKLRNPHYPPELCVKVNLLNFMATAEGLQDQMLGKVVAMEQKKLENQRQQLVVEDAENQRQLKEIEDKILDLLKTAEGNILDDEVLINTLADSKTTSDKINEKVKIAETTSAKIARVRQGYMPVAFQAAQLFFCIADLATIDPMYQYSLDWYIALFVMSIEKAKESKKLEERLQNLNDCFAFLLYQNVCRSLFEKDKLIFSFLLTTRIMLGKEKMDSAELRFFLQGSTSMELSSPNPFPSWLPDIAWGNLLAMSKLPSFATFLDMQFTINAEDWEGVMSSNDPVNETKKIIGDDADPFRIMCILRCLRPDAVVPAVQQFIAGEMGSRFIEPPPFDIRGCYNDSKCFTPLIFVLTPGADPMTQLMNLAVDMDMDGNRMQAISLGQGQGPIAEKAITNAAEKGMWVCLQNCHLSISWMPTLERICEEFSEDTLHPNFRLWLTSEPSPAFPAFVLQNGVKMTNEPPKGMKANLLGSLSSCDREWFDTCQRRNEFKKMLFGLTFFHAAVRERKKFGPLGWNIQYVFSPPDLRISMDQLRIFLDEIRPEDPIPYAALSYLVGECNYGGRVTDDKDRRCIMNILDDYYTPEIQREGYKFSPSGTYYAPEVPGTLENFTDYVRSLPLNEGPEVFGLHDNANISCAIAETNALLDTCLLLQPKESGGTGKSWAAELDELARDIASKIPTPFDIEKALIMFPVRYSESMNTVLTQELIRFNRLTEEITRTLKEVQKAIKGLVVMSAELEQMGNSCVIGKVPTLWSRVAYPSLKALGSWVLDYLDRIKFLADWMETGQSPCVYWISGFFFTQAFITGTLQNFARKHKHPIDTVDFDFRVLTAAEMTVADGQKPEDGAFMKGLFMDGARWDAVAHAINESNPRELFVTVPYIHLEPKLKSEIPIVEGVPEQYTGFTNGTDHVYMCPVYKTSFRQGVLSTTGHSTNFVMFIRLPMMAEHKQKHWIKRGVALLTQLDS